MMIAHRCRSRQIFGDAKDFCPTLPTLARKKTPKKITSKENTTSFHFMLYFISRIVSNQGTSSTIVALISLKLAQIALTCLERTK